MNDLTIDWFDVTWYRKQLRYFWVSKTVNNLDNGTCVKPPTTSLFVEQLIQTNDKTSSRFASQVLCGKFTNTRFPPHRGPVMQKEPPCRDAILNRAYVHPVGSGDGWHGVSGLNELVMITNLDWLPTCCSYSQLVLQPLFPPIATQGKYHIMTSSNANIFRVTDSLWGYFTGHHWIPLIKASDAELWSFLWCAPEQMVG